MGDVFQQSQNAWHDFFRPTGPGSAAALLGGTGDTPGIFGGGQFRPDQAAAQMQHGDFWQNAAQGGYTGAAAGQGVQLNQAQSGQSRDMQMGLAQQLQAQANGTGPSLAQGQLQKGMDSNIAQAYAMAQANPNDAGALRNIANQRAQIGQQTAGDAAQLRLQEQMQAQNQLGQLSTGMRGQDIGVASDNANLQQQAMQYYMGAGMSQDQAQAQLQMQLQQLKLQGYLGAASNNQAMFKDVLGATSGALGTAATSDERVKRNVVRHGVEARPGVPFASWEYLEGHGKPGRWLGVIAQDLEKVAPEHVHEDGNGVKWVSAAYAPRLIGEG